MHRCLACHRLELFDRLRWTSQKIGKGNLKAIALIHSQHHWAWSLVTAEHHIARNSSFAFSNRYNILIESKDHTLWHCRAQTVEHVRLVERDYISLNRLLARRGDRRMGFWGGCHVICRS